MIGTLAILAPGLLGASLAQAAKSRSLAKRVVVWARRVETRMDAARQPWCDAVFDTPEEAAAEADFIVLCPPVESIVPLAERIAEALKPHAIVTDVGSTKSLICRYAHKAIHGGAVFVGSHPMAGSEKSGMAHATAELFTRRPCFVTPLDDTPEKAVKTVVHFWRELDMEVTTIAPEAHDEIVANISHLPHVLATVLCTHLAEHNQTWAAFSGQGLADTTRIAAGSPPLWRSIVEQNREEILRSITAFENELHQFKSALANENYFEVLHKLELGKRFRDKLQR
ncbi:MAG: prephenate dehydrogenase/arogenate dehydrogenase family protein [Verrucomicrobiota bacterium]|nr:prephenate dehydrogenase/arogenate dehydrogenase family protein [Verrucomicrobiota bacterium]